MTSYIFSVERAKSGRAKCKGCNQPIPKDSVRMGIKGEMEGSEEGGGGFSMVEAQKWFHMNVDCVSKFRKGAAWWKTNTPTMDSIRGLDGDLESESESVEELLESLRTIGEPSSTPSTARTSASSSSGTERSKRKERSDANNGGSSDEELDEEAASPSAKKKTKTTSAKTNGSGDSSSGYAADSLSEEQVKKIKTEMSKLRGYKNDDLKKILKQNDQIVSGKKEDLIERCAEGMILGAIPKCPTCSKKVLRFDRETGNYTCPGSFEGGQMVRCKFSADDVERLPWSIPSED